MQRRNFLLAASASATAPWLTLFLAARVDAANVNQAAAPGWLPAAWLEFTVDGSILVRVLKSEMGQGVMTALPMLVAEELDVPLTALTIELAPAALAYRDTRGNQTTGYSSSVSSSFLPLRKLAAAARQALVTAAAQRWSVSVQSLQTSEGVVVDPANEAHRARYRDLLADARQLVISADPPLRERAQWRSIGTRPIRVDTPSKVDGSANFGMDIRLPGMLVGVVERAPSLAAKLLSIDSRRSLRIPGVSRVATISSGVLVLAKDFWSAQRGRKALQLRWRSPPDQSSSADHERELTQRLAMPGAIGRLDGQPDSDPAAADVQALHADYYTPFLAHAAMEPLACTAWVQKRRCDVWVGTQAPSRAQNHASELTGLAPEQVFVHSLQIGGAFGRRGEWDFVVEAVEAAMLAGQPVKIIWSREDDLQHDFYRPATANRLTAALGASGKLISLTHRISAPSVARRRSPEILARGHDFLLTQGSFDMEYAVPNLRVDYHEVDLGVPVGFWRSVGHSHNGFVIESFVDELAHAAKRDPLEFRLALLAKAPRMQQVLQRAATAAQWGTPLPAGRARGIACMKSYGSYVAQVAQVAVVGGAPVVERVVCAIDAGIVVHPGIVEQQMHSGIVFGLSAALGGEISFANGTVQQSNYHDYPPLRMLQMPQIDVIIIDSDASPGGCGEPATPVIAPAVCNAIFAATGQRLRRLPINRITDVTADSRRH